MRHKHEPVGVKSGGDFIIEECKICKMRRISYVSGTWSKSHNSRWVTKEISEKYMLSWLWHGED